MIYEKGLLLASRALSNKYSGALLWPLVHGTSYYVAAAGLYWSVPGVKVAERGDVTARLTQVWPLSRGVQQQTSSVALRSRGACCTENKGLGIFVHSRNGQHRFSCHTISHTATMEDASLSFI